MRLRPLAGLPLLPALLTPGILRLTPALPLVLPALEFRRRAAVALVLPILRSSQWTERG
jgi:hypothetical protein